MVAYNLNDASLAVKDKYEEEVGSWAVQVARGVARCKVCLCTILFNKGRGSLVQHSETEKHRKNRTAKPIGDFTEEPEGSVKNEINDPNADLSIRQSLAMLGRYSTFAIVRKDTGLEEGLAWLSRRDAWTMPSLEDYRLEQWHRDEGDTNMPDGGFNVFPETPAYIPEDRHVTTAPTFPQVIVPPSVSITPDLTTPTCIPPTTQATFGTDHTLSHSQVSVALSALILTNPPTSERCPVTNKSSMRRISQCPILRKRDRNTSMVQDCNGNVGTEEDVGQIVMGAGQGEGAGSDVGQVSVKGVSDSGDGEKGSMNKFGVPFLCGWRRVCTVGVGSGPRHLTVPLPRRCRDLKMSSLLIGT